MHILSMITLSRRSSPSLMRGDGALNAEMRMRRGDGAVNKQLTQNEIESWLGRDWALNFLLAEQFQDAKCLVLIISDDLLWLVSLFHY